MDVDPTARTLDELLRHERFVRRLARIASRRAGDADDLVQETWLRAAEHPPHPGGSALGWLGHRDAQRRARLAPRRVAPPEARSRGRAPRGDAAAAAGDRAPGAAAQGRRTRSRALPEAHASALVLRYFDGLPAARDREPPVDPRRDGQEAAHARARGAPPRARRDVRGRARRLDRRAAAARGRSDERRDRGGGSRDSAASQGGSSCPPRSRSRAPSSFSPSACSSRRARCRGSREPENEARAPADSGATVAGGPETSGARRTISPKPFREERARVGRRRRRADRLEVVVLDDAGRPVHRPGDPVPRRHCARRLLHGGALRDLRDLGESLSFPATTLPASIAFISYGRDPAVEELSRGSGSVTIRLRKGAVVERSRPRERERLRRRSSSSASTPWPTHRALDSWPPGDRSPDEGAGRRSAAGFAPGPIRKTGASGSWASTRSGEARSSRRQGYRVDGQKNGETRLQKPETGLVVNLVELPHLRGRVVSGPERAPELASLAGPEHRSGRRRSRSRRAESRRDWTDASPSR